MRIGIDLQVLAKKHLTGVGKYALNISRALLELKTEHEFVLFVPATSPSIPPLARGGRVVVLPEKTLPFFSAHWTYAKIMQKAKLDVLFGPANVLPWFYPSRPPGADTLPSVGEGSKVVITLHDLAIYKHLEWFPRGQWFSTKFLVPRSIKRATRIIVPSQATARDVVELFRVPSEKIAVIPHGVESRFFEPTNPKSQAPNSKQIPNSKYQIQNTKYILFVGTLEPRKNVKRLIEAYQLLPEGIKQEYELWIAGEPAVNPELIIDNRLSIRGKIRALGYVPDEDLPALYQGAAVFVYPSLYEGFGLPVLEAMAAGVPVITSRGTAMEELSTSPRLATLSRPGEGKGEVEPLIMVNPDSVTEIRDAILKYLSPPSKALGTLSSSGESNKVASLYSRDNAYLSQISESGQELARLYTWQRAARLTLETITNS